MRAPEKTRYYHSRSLQTFWRVRPGGPVEVNLGGEWDDSSFNSIDELLDEAYVVEVSEDEAPE
jgi:hypothetical protein